MSDAGRSRVARDEHGERAKFEDIEIGADLGSLEWSVTADDVAKQCLIDDDYHENYALGDFDAGKFAPPQIQYRPPRWLFSRTYNVRGVFYRWKFENVKPIRVGEKYLVTGRVANKWIKNNREFVAFEFEAKDEKDDVVFRTTRVHALDVIERTAPREGQGIDSGIKQEKI